MGMTFTFGSAQSLEGAYLDVELFSDWSVSYIEPDKRLYNSFNGCLVPFHECLFSILRFRLPFNDFEM